MNRHFRQKDREALEQITNAFRGAVYGAQPSKSVGMVAAFLNRGSDDPHEVSESTLRKVLDGHRKFPVHKLARLAEITSSDDVIKCLARQHGGLFYRAARGDNIDHQAMPAALRKFARFIEAVGDSKNIDVEHGIACAELEKKTVHAEGHNAIAAILHVIAECCNEEGQ